MSEGHPLTRKFLRYAYEGKKDDVIKMLDEGVPIDATHQSGLQALHFAAKSGNVEMATELLNRGASVNAVTQKGSTALHIGALLGKTDVVKLLLKSGAHVNKLSMYNGESFTPLYMAAQIGHQEIVTLLLAYGGDPTIQTMNGSTARFVARQQGYCMVAQILGEYEARYRSKHQPGGGGQGAETNQEEQGACGDSGNEDLGMSLAKLNLSDENLLGEDGYSSSTENKENNSAVLPVENNSDVLPKSSQNGQYVPQPSHGHGDRHPGASARSSERRFDSGKDIIMNKIRASLPPVYGEMIPSPMNSPRRVPRKHATNKQ